MNAIVGVDWSALIRIECCRSIPKKVHSENVVAAVSRGIRPQPGSDRVFLSNAASPGVGPTIVPTFRDQRRVDRSVRQGIRNRQRIDVNTAAKKIYFRRV